MKLIKFKKLNKITNSKNQTQQVINPFQGLPSYFIRKGKKQIIQKYFKLFFFKILKTTLMDKNKKNQNLYDSFFRLYWQTLPVCELKILNKIVSGENSELLRIKNPHFNLNSRKIQSKNQDFLFGFNNIPRNRDNLHPLVYISSDKNNYNILPLSSQNQEKLRKRWTFKSIQSFKKGKNLSEVLYNSFTNDLNNSKSKLVKESNIALKYFTMDLRWTLKNIKFFQDDLFLSNILFKRTGPIDYDEVQNQFQITKRLELFFFQRSLNKYLKSSQSKYSSLNYLNKCLSNDFNTRYLIEKNKTINIDLLRNYNTKLNKLNIIGTTQKRFYSFYRIQNFKRCFSTLSSTTKTNLKIEKLKYFNIQIKLILTSFDKFSLYKSKQLFIKNLNFINQLKISTQTLPLSRKLYTVLSSPHVYKTTRDQFEKKIYKESIILSLNSQLLTKNFINTFLKSLKKFSPSVNVQYKIIKK